MVKMVYFVYILFTLKKMAEEEGKGIREECKVHTKLKQKILSHSGTPPGLYLQN